MPLLAKAGELAQAGIDERIGWSPPARDWTPHARAFPGSARRGGIFLPPAVCSSDRVPNNWTRPAP